MTIEQFSRLGEMTLGGMVATTMLLAGIGMNHMRNGGELDMGEQLLSDFRTDILPPRMFIVESFANASIMTIHRNSYSANEGRLADLENSYWDAERRWAQRPLFDDLKAGLAANAQASGRRSGTRSTSR